MMIVDDVGIVFEVGLNDMFDKIEMIVFDGASACEGVPSVMMSECPDE